VKVRGEAPDAGAHRVQRDRLLRPAAARVLGGVVGEERGEQRGGQLRDMGGRPGLDEPIRERGAVPAVLPDGVRRAAIGFELENERLESLLELHAHD
jgi:hypothetical protein